MCFSVWSHLSKAIPVKPSKTTFPIITPRLGCYMLAHLLWNAHSEDIMIKTCLHRAVKKRLWLVTALSFWMAFMSWMITTRFRKVSREKHMPEINHSRQIIWTGKTCVDSYNVEVQCKMKQPHCFSVAELIYTRQREMLNISKGQYCNSTQ